MNRYTGRDTHVKTKSTGRDTHVKTKSTGRDTHIKSKSTGRDTRIKTKSGCSQRSRAGFTLFVGIYFPIIYSRA